MPQTVRIIETENYCWWFVRRLPSWRTTLTANFIALLRDRAVICDYCNSQLAEGEMKCGNCGAPIVVDAASAPDYRHCPLCHRKLLALGSPACSYCGRRLPADYLKARESDLKRINEIHEDEKKGCDSVVDVMLRQTAGLRSKKSSTLLDIIDLTDLF